MLVLLKHLFSNFQMTKNNVTFLIIPLISSLEVQVCLKSSNEGVSPHQPGQCIKAEHPDYTTSHWAIVQIVCDARVLFVRDHLSFWAPCTPSRTPTDWRNESYQMNQERMTKENLALESYCYYIKWLPGKTFCPTAEFPTNGSLLEFSYLLFWDHYLNW